MSAMWVVLAIWRFSRLRHVNQKFKNPTGIKYVLGSSDDAASTNTIVDALVIALLEDRATGSGGAGHNAFVRGASVTFYC